MDPTDDNDTLIALADDEVRRVRSSLEARVPPDYPVSIYLYQPVGADEHPDGRLVDVAPRPPGAPDGVIFQPLSAGHTGAFFSRADAAEIFEPLVQAIDQQAIDTYGSSPLSPAGRQRQVRLESLRYPLISFPSQDLPPEGSYIHQMALAPSVAELALLDFPILGMVYTITPDGDRTREVRHLVHVSQRAGQAALFERVKLLWGEDLLLAARREVDTAYGKPDTDTFDNAHRLGILFVLSHHWFYPQRPIAWRLLDDLSRRRWFGAFGWQPPLLRVGPANVGLRENVDVLHRDFLHLCYQLCGPERLEPREIRLRKALTGGLATMLGDEMWLERPPANSTELRICTSKPRNGLITLVPPEPWLAADPGIPVFEERRIWQSARRRHREGPGTDWVARIHESLKPCPSACTKGEGRYGTKTPLYWLQHDGREGFVLIDSAERAERQNWWLVQFSRLILEEHALQRIRENKGG